MFCFTLELALMNLYIFTQHYIYKDLPMLLNVCLG